MEAIKRAEAIGMVAKDTAEAVLRTSQGDLKQAEEISRIAKEAAEESTRVSREVVPG